MQDAQVHESNVKVKMRRHFSNLLKVKFIRTTLVDLISRGVVFWTVADQLK